MTRCPSCHHLASAVQPSHIANMSAANWITFLMRITTWCLAALLVLLALPTAAADQATAWHAMSRPGHAVLMRHANAPGTGDPVDFTFGDCSTQRNLNNAGREQARRVGAWLREHGIDDRRVYTSRWCRCSETAALLDIGPVEPLDGLNSFFGDAYAEQEVMRRLRAFLREDQLDPPPVLVTHQVNITALTGVFPREGELVVIAVDDDGGVDVVERVRLGD